MNYAIVTFILKLFYVKTIDYILLILRLQLGLAIDALNYLLLGFQSSLNILFFVDKI